MKQVIAFIKPHQLSPAAMGLRDIPELTGMSITKGQGFGRGRGRGQGQRIVFHQHFSLHISKLCL